MKSKLLLILFSFFIYNSLHSQDVPEVQQSLIAKLTATWCINCGTWGWNLFDGLVEDNSDKALVIANHFNNSSLDNATSDAIAANFNVFGQPRFILNNTDQNVSSGNIATKRTEIKNQVDANFLLSPIANSGITATLEGDMLTVNTKTKFFQTASGEYYIGVYIIEDGVINAQTGQGSNAIHQNVLRAGMSLDAFGELIMDGSIGMGMEFNHEFSIMLESGWNKDALTVASIIWKKEGNDYSFVNTNSTSTFGTGTAVTEITPDQLTMDVLPTVTTDNSTLNINVYKAQEQINIYIYDDQGRLIQSVYSGNLLSGQHDFLIGEGLSKGLYFVNLQNEAAVLTKRLIVQ